MTTMSHFTFQHLHMSSTLLSWVRKKQNPVVNPSIFVPGLHSRMYRGLALHPCFRSPILLWNPDAEKAMTFGMRRGVLVCSRKHKFTTCISIGNHIYSYVHALLDSGPYVRHNLSMTQTHLHTQLHFRALATRSSSSIVSCEIAHVFVLFRERMWYNVTPLIFRCNHDNDVSLHVPAFTYE